MPALIPDEQLERLRRENWQGVDGPTRLAQEMYAMLGSINPITANTNLTINQADPTLPALTINPSSDPGAVPAVSFPGGSSGGGSGTTPSNDQFPSPPTSGSLAPLYPVQLYGVVQSGSGHDYIVRVWITEPSSGTPLGDYPCYQAQIDPAETIPSGTVCLVWCSWTSARKLTGFRMTVPVFLA